MYIFLENFYKIDKQNLNAEIKAKVEQIINDETYYQRISKLL